MFLKHLRLEKDNTQYRNLDSYLISADYFHSWIWTNVLVLKVKSGLKYVFENIFSEK